MNINNIMRGVLATPEFKNKIGLKVGVRRMTPYGLLTHRVLAAYKNALRAYAAQIDLNAELAKCDINTNSGVTTLGITGIIARVSDGLQKLVSHGR